MKKRLKQLLAHFGYQIVKIQRNESAGGSGLKHAGFAEHLLEKTIIDRSYDEAGLLDDEFYSYFKSSTDTHKWHHYFPIYSTHFSKYREKPIRMLEIGVRDGGSLNMWKNWFHSDAIVVGLDIDPSCMKFDSPKDNKFVRIGDQSDDLFLREVTKEFGPFDIILDDGGHTTGQMIASFNSLFRESLNDDGMYIVEDTHTNYVNSFIDTDITFVDLCKSLIDIMHKHYVITGSPAAFRIDRGELISELEVPYLTAYVNSMTIYDSVIAIEKQRRPLPSNEHRH